MTSNYIFALCMSWKNYVIKILKVSSINMSKTFCCKNSPFPTTCFLLAADLGTNHNGRISCIYNNGLFVIEKGLSRTQSFVGITRRLTWKGIINVLIIIGFYMYILMPVQGTLYTWYFVFSDTISLQLFF
jgi:hypothetical protein